MGKCPGPLALAGQAGTFPLRMEPCPIAVMHRTRAARALRAAVALAGFGLVALARASEGGESVTAVASRVSRDYVRTKAADGSFAPEEYAFGKGGHYPGPFPDDSIDKLDFLDVARAIAGPLARQNYVPSRDPRRTRLLIMVYWGTTWVSPTGVENNGYQLYQSAAAANPGSLRPGQSNSEADEAFALMDAENKERDHLDFSNANLLGYNTDAGAVIGTEYGDAIKRSALRGRREALVSEIEQNRYFVVLMAYDFQLMWRQKKHKLLWDARFSIDQRHTDFAKALPAMAMYASAYFGQDSDGLVRHPIPEGHVNVGEPTLIELLFPAKK